MKQFKCVVPYLPPQFQYHSKHGYDTTADPVCINKTSNEMETIMRFYDHYSSNGQRNFCQMPCTTMEVKSVPLKRIVTCIWIKEYLDE